MNVLSAWWPRMGGLREARLSCRVKANDGRALEFDGARFPIPGMVQPGEEATFVCALPGLQKAGDYLIEWDMAIEEEGSLHEFVGNMLISRLHVTRRHFWSELSGYETGFRGGACRLIADRSFPR